MQPLITSIKDRIFSVASREDRNDEEMAIALSRIRARSFRFQLCLKAHHTTAVNSPENILLIADPPHSDMMWSPKCKSLS